MLESRFFALAFSFSNKVFRFTLQLMDLINKYDKIAVNLILSMPAHANFLVIQLTSELES